MADDFVLCAGGDFAEERDAAKDGVDLIDLLVELLDERLEEIELLLHEAHRHVFVPLPDRVDDLIDALDVAGARRFRRGDKIVRDTGQRRNDNDRMPIATFRDDVDRIRHALRVADGRAAEFDDDHCRPPTGRQTSGVGR